MWCIDPTGQEGTTTADNKTFKPTEVLALLSNLVTVWFLIGKMQYPISL